MDAYLIPIKTALSVFPLLAVFLTFPYLFYQYRKYGAVPFLRSAVLYSFVFYLLSAYFLVILPLPSQQEIANCTGPAAQWVPFQFISNFFKETTLVLKNPATWLPALKQNCVLQVVFNLLLFLPFGVYLRYYFHCGWKKILLFSFLLSLFFELTQLTGLYGIYPRSYRLFDVDDLLLNTCGGLFGYKASGLLCGLLPSRERLDQIAYQKGAAVPFFRRLSAFLIDLFLMALLALPTLGAGSVLYFILAPGFTGGYTLGLWLLRLRVAAESQGDASFLQYTVRNAGLLLSLIIFPLLFCFWIFLRMFRKKGSAPRFLHEYLSGTRLISTIEAGALSKTSKASHS